MKHKLMKIAQHLALLACINATSISSVFANQEAQRPPQTSIPQLDWRSIAWAPLQYTRIPIGQGGASLYTLKSPTDKKFRLEFIFMPSAFTFSPEELPAFYATASMLLQGGTQKQNFESIQNFLEENSSKLTVEVTPGLYLQVRAEGLIEDFSSMLHLVEEVLTQPKFDKDAFNVWKQQTLGRFEAQLDADNMREQIAFSTLVTNRFVFGEKSYMGINFTREKPAYINALTHTQLANMAKNILTQTGLNILAAGPIESKHEAEIQKLVEKLPRNAPRPLLWEPERPQIQPNDKPHLIVIRKKDMQQCWVQGHFFVPELGKLSDKENFLHNLAFEVFFASSGVVGNDRWSKAMRAESGLSYSAFAHFFEQANFPNTNTGLYRLIFQSPNDKIHSALLLAQKTWNTFVQEGIKQSELDAARMSLMNSSLNTEHSIFDKAAVLNSHMIKKQILSPTYIEDSLANLEILKNQDQINAFIKNLGKKKFIKVFVILGNPDKKILSDTKNFASTKEINFEMLVKSL